jgi:hypothetical protein
MTKSSIHSANSKEAEQPTRTKRSIVTLVVLTFALSPIGYMETIASEETSVLLVIEPALAPHQHPSQTPLPQHGEHR